MTLERMTLLAALAAGLVANGCEQRDAGAELTREQSGALGAPSVRVRVVKAKKEETSGVRVFPGVLRPWQRAQLGSRASGELTSMRVDRGDKVKKGQLLATIGVPGLAQDVQRAGAQKSTAEAELRELEDRKRRMAEVLASGPKGVIAEGEITALDAKIEAARARIGAAAADEGRGGAMLSDTRVLAPFDGVVSERRVDKGTALSPGTIILEVVDVSILRMTVDVPERDAASVKLGQAVDVVIGAMGDRKVKGTIARFAPALDEATRTLRVEIDVPNADGALLGSVSARAAIDFGTRGEVLTLPADAVVQKAGEAFVFVVEGSVARRRAVTVAYDRGATVEIGQGIEGPEEIVVGGRGLVEDGRVIEVAR